MGSNKTILSCRYKENGFNQFVRSISHSFTFMYDLFFALTAVAHG